MFGKLSSRVVLSTAALILALCIAPYWAFAAQSDGTSVGLATSQGENGITVTTAESKPMDLRWKYSAYMTNGRGAAYKSYTSPMSPYGKQPVIYKARIKGNKLYLSGSYGKHVGTTSKTYKAKNKTFKLTSKTKYYRHYGNNNFYEKWTKSEVKSYLNNKSSQLGGDIYFNVKNGKITALSVQ